MFESIVNILELALSAFGMQQSYQHDKNYKELYLLFLAMDDVISHSELVIRHYLGVDWNAPLHVNPAYHSSPLDKWVTITNQDFEKLTDAVKKFTTHFSRCRNAIGIYDPSLARALSITFVGKMLLLTRFSDVFDAGTISKDGEKLITKSLKVANFINKKLPKDNLGYLLDEANVSVREIKVSSIENRQRLIGEASINIMMMKEVREKLRVFIKDNVRIEQLL